MLLLVAVMAFFPFSGQFVEADAASTSFNPTQVSLLAIGESATITVETVDVDADASGVQINVQHSANLAVSNPACVGIFSAADFLIGPSTVDGGTLFGCAFLSETVSDTTGDVMTYTLTRVGDFDEENITFLAGGPQGLGFSIKGISKGPGEINRLSVIGFLRDDPPMVNNNTESVSVGDLPDESYVRSPINSSETSEIVTPDARVQVTVPQGALPANVGGAVEIEVKNIEVSITPDAPDNAVIVRAIELNTLVDGEVTPTDYEEPVELSTGVYGDDSDGDLSIAGLSIKTRIVSDSLTLGTDKRTLTVFCGDDEVATGGGFDQSSDYNVQMDFLSSLPITAATSTGWSVTGYNKTNREQKMTVFVVCSSLTH
ncbi:MAG: hypothetical protein IIB14_05385 [Chloroflexi bacterium]|nr:hypothetical protein [Chloroflexota bacterium]